MKKRTLNEVYSADRAKNPDGVSFLMGINPRTGVPYACMQEPAIAKLWMMLRDNFIDINQSRAKGSRLTNIKVAINSQNTERCTYGSDLGESQVIVGGP